MTKTKHRFITLFLNLVVTITVFIDGSTTLYKPKVIKTVNDLLDGSGMSESKTTTSLGSRSDDEDTVTGAFRSLQSSGDGPMNSPDVYPSLDPYTRTRSTATILVDVAFAHQYRPYMLPGAAVTPQLRSFQSDIIEQFKNELHTIYVKLDFKILSLRPGPVIPKRLQLRNPEKVPTVFVRMNITQFNSSIVNPLIIFRISQCGRLGVLGNRSISDQIIFPQYVCTDRQVYCLPDCRTGAYCDGVVDCPENKLDEPDSCSKCLYKHVTLVPSRHLLDDDEELILDCNVSRECQEMKQKVRWKFPLQLKSYEEIYRSVSKINTLPKSLLTSGIYRCTVDGESSSTNITVFKKPSVLVTKADPEADLVIISEIEGTRVEYWCNTTDGIAVWAPVAINGVEISNYNERSSKITFREITKAMANSYHCLIHWGHARNKVIKKSTTIMVLCDLRKNFECKNVSSKRSCIPMNQKCDSITQCDDGSDEEDCRFCKEKEILIDTQRHVAKDVGDTLIITCSSTNTLCKPISWWTRGQMLGPTGNIFSFMESLFIVQARIEHTGLYQCFDVSKKTSAEVYVHINAAPTINVPSSTTVFNIPFGQSRAIDCFVNYPTNSTYHKRPPRWVKANRNQLPLNADVTTLLDLKSTIMFKKSQPSMSGVYYCEVTWGTMNSKVVRVAVTVNVTPLICGSGERMCVDNTMCLAESLWCDGSSQCDDGSDEKQCDKCTNGFVFVEPRQVTVLVGQPVELMCFYDKDCYPVKWRIALDRKPLTSVTGLEIQDNKLLINNAGLDATNTYECYSGVQRFQSNVTVIRQVELNLSAPYVIVRYGENINVNCKSNYGKPQWRRRDSKPLSSIFAIRVSHPSERIASLNFNSPSYDANGYYVCFVRLNPKEEEVASMLMYVYVKSLVCSTDQLSCDGNTKCISKSRICDSVRDCNDGADEKTCSKCKSNLEVKPNSMTVTTLGYGVLKCIVPNSECLPIKWKFMNQSSIKNSRFHPFEDSLYIINPRLSDYGEVQCTSGSKSASALLIVKELVLTIEPAQPDNSPMHILKGHSRRIICKSNLGSPRWIFPEESFVQPFGVRYSNTDENVAVLDIVNIQKEATLIYICEVEFSRETKRRNLSITVI